MSRIRVYEVARQLNVDQKTLVSLFQSLGFNDVRNHMSAVEPDAVERVKRHLEKQETAPVVEERIHPTVVKRRATARKPSVEPMTTPKPPPVAPAAPKELSSTSSATKPRRTAAVGDSEQPKPVSMQSIESVAVPRAATDVTRKQPVSAEPSEPVVHEEEPATVVQVQPVAEAVVVAPEPVHEVVRHQEGAQPEPVVQPEPPAAVQSAPVEVPVAPQPEPAREPEPVSVPVVVAAAESKPVEPPPPVKEPVSTVNEAAETKASKGPPASVEPVQSVAPAPEPELPPAVKAAAVARTTPEKPAGREPVRRGAAPVRPAPEVPGRSAPPPRPAAAVRPAVPKDEARPAARPEPRAPEAKAPLSTAPRAVGAAPVRPAAAVRPGPRPVPPAEPAAQGPASVRPSVRPEAARPAAAAPNPGREAAHGPATHAGGEARAERPARGGNAAATGASTPSAKQQVIKRPAGQGAAARAAQAAKANEQRAAARPSTPPPSQRTSQMPQANAGAGGTSARTGIETWAGRPGVPVRQPPISRTQPQQQGPNAGPVPRRVQYDPKANAPTAPKVDPRGGAAAAQNRKPWISGKGGAGGGRRPQGGMLGARKPAAPSTKEMSEHKKIIKIEAKVSLQTIAQRMSLKATEVLMKLLSMGMTGVNINSTLDADTAKLVAAEFGWDVEDVAVSEEEALGLTAEDEEEDEASLVLRPPIVTVMGHVDHGKTSLLDQIRKTNVVASEAGGITQHIGAYKVSTSRGPITFLDTPGHAAFTQMRARGAQVTDIVILVVAADDGVMPQTREAVNHARAANVPIIVAVNKIDKPGAQPERIRRELADMSLVAEDWGGDTIFCDVSAKTREGLENLLEMTALQAELLELRANPGRAAVGNVLEALLDRGRGPVARVIITDGTLHTGDVILAGTAWGRVRAMTDDRGRQVAEAGPSTPVEILGLSEVPSAGDPIHVVKDPKKAQEVAASRKSKASQSLIPASAKVSLEVLAKRMAEADQLELRLIIKADVQGSVEALAESLARMSTEKVRVAIIHAAVGGITEGDVNLAVASKAIIVGFNVRPAGKAASLAESEGIEIRTYAVIYDAVEDIKKAMLGLIGPTMVERSVGKAEVRQTFHIAKIGTVAGCMVQEGTIKRNSKVRLVRDSIQIWEGRLASVKRFKEDAREVDKGFECGLSLEGFNDVKVGDTIECFEESEVEATL